MNKYKSIKNSVSKGIIISGIAALLMLIGNKSYTEEVANEINVNVSQLNNEINKFRNESDAFEVEKEIDGILNDLETNPDGGSIFSKLDKETLNNLISMDNESDWFNSGDLYDPQTMHASEYIKAVIKCFEGYKSDVYVINGDYTVGYGHSLGKEYTGKKSYTAEECNRFFEEDINECEKAIRSAARDWSKTSKFAGLSQGMYDALVMYIFHLGRGNFRNKSQVTNNLLNISRYTDVPDAIKNCKVKPGHETRRALEALIFTGEKVNPQLLRSAPATLDTSVFNGMKTITKDDLLRK